MQKINSLLNSLPFQGKEATRWFTLVELIVVITILAILWTIAFISLQWYSKDARDSVRISDISKIKTSLELFQLDAWKYPETTTPTNITYSWAIAWTQWTFWEETFNNVTKLDKIPLDPVTDRKYVYSVTNTKQEYQLAWIMEWDEVTWFLNQTNATLKTAMLKISWNYNWKLLKVSTGGIDYILAIPSIITSSWFTLEQIVAGKLLAYNGYKNLPAQYAGSSYDLLWDSAINLINNSNLVVYSWSLATLSDTTQTWIDARKEMIIKLQNAYSWTALTSIWEISQILSTQTTNSAATEALSTTMVSNNLWWSITASSGWWQTAVNSCKDSSKPTDNWHITFTVGTPTSLNQDYVKDATNCWYICTGWYTWNDCSLPNFYQNCNSVWQKLIASTTYWTCSAPDIIICFWSWTWYTLAACNVWTNVSWIDRITSWWYYFQWGRNKWFDRTDASQQSSIINWDIWLNMWTDTYWFVWNSSFSSPYSWANTNITENWWVKESEKLTATYLNSTSTYRQKMQWPCLDWYHVPTKQEWSSLFYAWDWHLWDTAWTATVWDDLKNALKLPITGSRHRYNGLLQFIDTYGGYRSSSPSNNQAYWHMFSTSNIDIWVNSLLPTSIALNVRCFKN
jgi:type II secretory pathway pseudopilin PulG